MHFITVDTAWQLRHDRHQHVREEFAGARRRRLDRRALTLVSGRAGSSGRR